jgi:hypothetical protein
VPPSGLALIPLSDLAGHSDRIKAAARECGIEFVGPLPGS